MIKQQKVWSQFSIKILGIHFGNSALDNTNWDELSHSLTKKINIWNSSLWDEKKNCKPNRLMHSLVYSSNTYYSKIYQKRNWKNNTKEIKKNNRKFSLKEKWPPRHVAHLSIWKCGLSILDIHTQLNSLEVKGIQIYLIPPMLSRRVSCCIILT